jgi:tyrosinase
MKSLFLHIASATTTFSLLNTAHAVPSNSSGPVCGAAIVDDSYFSVVGVQGTGVHPRQELRDLEKDTETWNMFVQALVRFQAMDQNEKISYYQIAGMVSLHCCVAITTNIPQVFTAFPSHRGIVYLL